MGADNKKKIQMGGKNPGLDSKNSWVHSVKFEYESYDKKNNDIELTSKCNKFLKVLFQTNYRKNTGVRVAVPSKFIHIFAFYLKTFSNFFKILLATVPSFQVINKSFTYLTKCLSTIMSFTIKIK